MTTTAINPFLDGNFAPVQEEITAETLEVIGQLPPELAGMFVRNGPNPQFTPIGAYHWFDGDGMLHGVQIQAGKATYRNRYVRTRGFMIEQEVGKAIWSGFSEPAQPDNPYGPYKNAGNTALVWHAGQMLALWEGGNPHAINLPSLDTVGEYNFDNQLNSAFTAHPKVDPLTGEMMFFGYSPFQPPYVKYGVVSSQGKIDHFAGIDLPMGVMMHDFAITTNYTIFMDLPLTLSPLRMQRGEPMIMFEADKPSRFGIMPRRGDNSNIRWFEAPSCYVFHTLNAYEDGEEVVLIACRMSSTSVLGLTPVSEGDIPYLYRWRFNLSTGGVTEEKICDRVSEFPRMNENYLGRPHRYGYSANIGGEGVPLMAGIIKHDLHTGNQQIHEFGQGRFGGEAVFAPRPGASHEDEGWLITFVYDSQNNISELVVINAQDMEGDAIARVIIPQRVPYGFHGIWIQS